MCVCERIRINICVIDERIGTRWRPEFIAGIAKWKDEFIVLPDMSRILSGDAE